MTGTLTPDAATRLLVIAPHPDDETLATGGLIQRVLGAGGTVRVVLVTDGDNNPWPQRWIERRWTITGDDRARWGARRRAEAAAALAVLAGRAVAVAHLGWPDQGVTHRLLRQTDDSVAALRAEMEAFGPNLLIAPSPHDHHPDHSAMAVLAALASAAAKAPAPTVFSFVVHARAGARPEPDERALDLTNAELATKRRAIACHTSQLALTSRRIFAHARPGEVFQPGAGSAALAAVHPVQAVSVAAGALTIAVDPVNGSGPRGDTPVALVIDRPTGVSVWHCDIPSIGDDPVAVRSAAGEPAPWRAAVRQAGRRALVTLPDAAIAGARRVFVKCRHRGWFFDRSGWQTLVVGT